LFFIWLVHYFSNFEILIINYKIPLFSFSAKSHIFGIPLSFLSIAFTTVKLFYSQRLGRFAEIKPSINMVLFVFPFAVFLIAGPVFTLIIFASYVKLGIILVIVILTVLASLLVSKCLISRQRNFGKENAPISYEFKEIAAGQQKGILIITALTSWITPCIVWTNNFVAKSYFLVSSSATSILAHALWP